MIDRVSGTMVIPAFREADTVASTLRILDGLCQRELSEVDWQLLVVDDGSEDATSSLAAEAATECVTPVRVLRLRQNEGLGGALRTGLAASRGDLVVTLDCDLSYGPQDIIAIVRRWLEMRPHVVLASPYMAGGNSVGVPRTLEVRSRGANLWLNKMALNDVKTLTGIVRAYDGPFIRSLALKAVGADINVEIIYKTQLVRGRILEVPATLNWSGLHERGARTSLVSYASRWNTYKQLVMGYLWRPFLFPAVAGLTFGLLAIILVIVGQLSLEAMAAVAAVLAVQLGFASLTNLQSKRYFEELFNLGYGLRTVAPTEPPRGSVALEFDSTPQHDSTPTAEVFKGQVTTEAAEDDSPSGTTVA